MTDAPEPSEVPAWPVVSIELGTDGFVQVDDDRIAVPAGADMRETAIRVVAATASLIGRPVRAEAREADGTVWPLIVTPEGRVHTAGTARRPAPAARRRGFRRQDAGPAGPAASVPVPLPPPPPAPAPSAPAARPASSRPPAPRPASPRPQPPAPPAPAAPSAPSARAPQVRPPAQSGPGQTEAPAPSWHRAPPAPAPGTAPRAVPGPGAEPEQAPGPAYATPRGPHPARRPIPEPDQFPEPDRGIRAALDQITSELRRGRPAAARVRAQFLVDRLVEALGRNSSAADAASEVLAYTTFVAGDAARASGLYAGLAMRRLDRLQVDPEVARLADNAHFCWTRALASPDAHKAGMKIVALRTAGWGEESPEARAARRLLAASTPINVGNLKSG